MRKMFALVSLLVLLGLVLSACGATAPTTTVPTATLTATATSAPTNTPTPTFTPTPAGPQLRTATDVRAFGRVIGWVTGGEKGEFVQGAQIALKSAFALKTLPEGDVLEFECVQYIVINGEVSAKPVCPGALVRFGTDSMVPADSILTLWLSHPVVGSETEKWDEGFLNKPCICADGDCRK
jgi:hypothetical protein